MERERDGWSSEYIYYIDRPKQLRHALALSDFYRELSKQAEIKKFLVEPTIGDFRPDAIVGFTDRGRDRTAFVEIELSNKGFDYHKYATFPWQQYMPMQPELFVVSDRAVGNTGYPTLNIGLDMDFRV